MNILATINALDFRNYTRRASYEAMARVCGGLDILCQSSWWRWRNPCLQGENIRFYRYVRIVPLRLRLVFGRVPLLNMCAARLCWGAFFKKYDVVVFSSSLQFLFLPLCPAKVVFLLRDPFYLRGTDYRYESLLIQAADLILASNQNLIRTYLPKYHHHSKQNVHYWPNTVDIRLWDYERLKKRARRRKKPTFGMAGNITVSIDLELLDLAAERYPGYAFEVAGELPRPKHPLRTRFEAILQRPNVRHIGFIPFDDLPATVMTWDVGLIIEAQTELGSYLHHNKLYQYLALAKPVVVLRAHDDYDHLRDVIHLAATREEFVDLLDQALAGKEEQGRVERALSVARENASDVRARQFLHILHATLGGS